MGATADTIIPARQTKQDEEAFSQMVKQMTAPEDKAHLIRC